MPTFFKRIPMHAQATIHLGERLGGGELEIKGKGYMVIGFLPRLAPELWRVHVQDVDLHFEPIRLPLAGHPIEVSHIHVTRCEFVLRNCSGLYNRETGDVSLHLAMLLSPERFSVLRELGVTDTLHFTLIEEGKMDFVEGRIIETHAAPFRIPAGFPEGLIRVSAGQHSCEAVGQLFIGIAGQVSEVELRRYQPKRVWVCAGTKIVLAWDIPNFNKIKSAEITGNPQPIAVNKAQGSVTIEAPNASADYTLKVTDSQDCESDDTVNVFVIKTGTKVEINAQTTDHQVYTFDFPLIQADPKIMVTSMTSELCLTEQTAYADWACTKVEPNAAVKFFNVHGIRPQWRPYRSQATGNSVLSTPEHT